MASFTERMVGAARLNAATYEEVEADTTATGQAAGVVLLASLAGGIGSVSLQAFRPGTFFVGAVGALVGWVVWAFLTYVIGTRVLPEPQTKADMGEMLRTLGFAQSPGLIRVLGIVPGLGALVLVVSAFWMLASMVVAVRQALDYTSTLRAIGVCLIGWVVAIIVNGLLLATMGLALR